VKRLLVAAVLLVPSAARADDEAQARAVSEALAAVGPRLHRCWERSAAADYRAEGKVDLKLTIGPGGKVSTVELRGSSVGREDLEACALAAFRAVGFGDAFAPGDAVEIPVTFKAEPNVTVRVDDAPPIARGPRASVRVLIDPLTAAATQASLTLVELKPGAAFSPPGQGVATVYVLSGRARAGADALAPGDALLYPDGGILSPVQATARTELLLLLTPPGGEEIYRSGASSAPLGAATKPPARRVASASAHRYPILGGKGAVEILVEEAPAAVSRLTIGGGAAVPEHVHAKEAELLFILAGKGQMTVDGQTYPVEPRMAIHVPAGARHAFTAGDAEVRAIQLYAPSGPEQRFKGK
jgi:TonB family protein